MGPIAVVDAGHDDDLDGAAEGAVAAGQFHGVRLDENEVVTAAVDMEDGDAALSEGGELVDGVVAGEFGAELVGGHAVPSGGAVNAGPGRQVANGLIGADTTDPVGVVGQREEVAF